MPKKRPDPWHVRLAELRKALGLHKQDMAARFGITPRAYTPWESGAVPLPQPVRLIIEWLEADESGELREKFLG